MTRPAPASTSNPLSEFNGIKLPVFSYSGEDFLLRIVTSEAEAEKIEEAGKLFETRLSGDPESRVIFPMWKKRLVEEGENLAFIVVENRAGEPCSVLLVSVNDAVYKEQLGIDAGKTTLCLLGVVTDLRYEGKRFFVSAFDAVLGLVSKKTEDRSDIEMIVSVREGRDGVSIAEQSRYIQMLNKICGAGNVWVQGRCHYSWARGGEKFSGPRLPADSAEASAELLVRLRREFGDADPKPILGAFIIGATKSDDAEIQKGIADRSAERERAGYLHIHGLSSSPFPVSSVALTGGAKSTTVVL